MAITTVPSVTDPRELALLKAVGLDRVSPEQRELALNIASRYELDLMLKHIVMIDGKPFITRDALLYIAHRSGQFDGIETTVPEIVGDEWRCSATVWRKDMSHPFTYGGRYPVKGGNTKYAPEMAIKVAESMALRRAFNVAAPVVEERWDLDVPPTDPAPRLTLAERAAEKRASLATVDRTDGQDAAEIMATPMTEDESDAMPYIDEADDVPDDEEDGPGLTPAAFAEIARAKFVGKVAMAAVLEVVPEKVAATIKAMDDAGRYRLGQSLGLV